VTDSELGDLTKRKGFLMRFQISDLRILAFFCEQATFFFFQKSNDPRKTKKIQNTSISNSELLTYFLACLLKSNSTPDTSSGISSAAVNSAVISRQKI
jgi:hypothetical protein